MSVRAAQELDWNGRAMPVRVCGDTRGRVDASGVGRLKT
jgi:hypothetical protein